MSILEPSKSCRAIRYSVIPIRKYKQLSPGINHNKAEVTSKIIDLKKNSRNSSKHGTSKRISQNQKRIFCKGQHLFKKPKVAAKKN